MSNNYSNDNRDYYRTVSYGINIRKRKRKQTICSYKTWTTEILLENTIDILLYIITDKSELSSEIKQGNIHIIDGATRFSLNDGIYCKYCPSGMILLCVCKIGAPEKITGVQ